MLALLKREWKLFIRTPLYVLNGLVGSIAGPFIVVVMYIVRGSDAELARLAESLQEQEVVPYAAPWLPRDNVVPTAGMNIVASTALSREGKNIWVAKMIPVAARHQADA